MAVRLRLRRVGSKKRPVYRLVAAEARNPRNGETIEEFGFYNPSAEPVVFDFDIGRVQHWLNVGAQPSATVFRLFAERGVVEKPKKRTSKEPGVSRKEKKARAGSK